MSEELHLEPCPFCGGPGEFTPHDELKCMITAGCADSDCPGHVVAYDFVSKQAAANFWNRRPAVQAGILTVDQIDGAITTLVVSGPHGAEAGVSIARIAGRALKMLQTVVGPKAAMVTAESLVANLKSGAIQ